MLIIYDETIIPDLVDIIYDMEMPKPIKIYVFSPNRNPYIDEFEDVEEKVELCALPAAIYDAYREVIPPMENKELKVTDNTKEEENKQWRRLAGRWLSSSMSTTHHCLTFYIPSSRSMPCAR